MFSLRRRRDRENRRKHRFWVRPIYGSSVLIILREFVIKTFIYRCISSINVEVLFELLAAILKRVYGREVSNQVHHGMCSDASVASIV